MSSPTHPVEPVVKKGWLNVQLANAHEFKQFFVILRPSSLDFHTGPKEVGWSLERLEQQILLENCIIIQALKKGPVRHAFTMLIVPEGLYTMSASSESEKSSWVKTVRETISKQSSMGEKIIASVNSQSKSPEKSNTPSLSRPSSRMEVDRNRRNSEQSSPEFRRKHLSYGSVGQDSGRSRRSFLSSKSLERPCGDKALQSLSDLRANSRQSYLTRRPTVTQVRDSRFLKEERPPVQDGFNHCKDGSLETLSISSTVDLRARNYSGGVNANTNSDKTRSRRQFLTVSGRNTPVLGGKITSTVFDGLQSISQGSRVPNQLSNSERPVSRMRHAEVGNTVERLWQNSPTSQMDQTERVIRSEKHRTNEPYPGRTPADQSAQLSKKSSENAISLPIRSVDIQQNSLPESMSNGIDQQRKTRGSSGSITILRENQPVNGEQTGRSSTLSRHITKVSENTNLEGPQGFRRGSEGWQVEDRLKYTHDENNPHSTSTKFQLGIFNFRQSFRRQKPNAHEARIITVPAGVANEVENSLLNENHLLRERIRLLHQQNSDLETKITNYREQVANAEVGGLHSQRPNGSFQDQHLMQEENSWKPVIVWEQSVQPQGSHTQAVEPEKIPARERVEAWLMGTSLNMQNEVGTEKRRQKMSKSRRSTTTDIPSAEYIRSVPITKDDSASSIPNRTYNREFNGHGTLDYSAYRKSPKSQRPLLDLNEGCASPIKSIGGSRPPTPLLNKLSYFASSDQTDPKYSSTMWCRLVDLWSTLLNEERKFWKLQLESVMLQLPQQQQEGSSSSLALTELLEKVNEKHTAETVMLWKHVYENWVPHDYLEYLTDEVRKGLTCLHKVIDTLFGIVECVQHQGDSCSQLLDKAISDLRQEVLKIRLLPQQSPLPTNASDKAVRARSCSVLENRVPTAISNQQRSMSDGSTESWQQTRMLLRECHSQLLDQVYGVAEMVGAALDTDMEDSMKAAKLDKTGEMVDPLKSIPSNGLQVAAKLQSLVLDLEARLAATSNEYLAKANAPTANTSGSNIDKSEPQMVRNSTSHISNSLRKIEQFDRPTRWSLQESNHFHLES